MSTWLDDGVSRLIERLEEHRGIREGPVLTFGPPPYRRVDCDGSALCYLRVRPKMGFIRVEIARFRPIPGPAPEEVRSSNPRSLIVADLLQIERAAEYLLMIAGRSLQSPAREC